MLGQAGGNQDARRYSLLSVLLGSLHTWLHDKTPQEFGALEGHDGLVLARMSGSGATCFALFDSDAAMADAAMAVQAAHRDWWIMETRIRTA